MPANRSLVPLLLIASALAAAPAQADPGPVACFHEQAEGSRCTGEEPGPLVAVGADCATGVGLVLYHQDGSRPTCYDASASPCMGGVQVVLVENYDHTFVQCVFVPGSCAADAALDASLDDADSGACASPCPPPGPGPVYVRIDNAGGTVYEGCPDRQTLQPFVAAVVATARETADEAVDEVLDRIPSILDPCPSGSNGVAGVACVTRCDTGALVETFGAAQLVVDGVCAEACGTPGAEGWGATVDFDGDASCDPPAVAGPWVALDERAPCPVNGRPDVTVWPGSGPPLTVCA